MNDINLSHLLFAKTPSDWHPYIKLARLDRPTGTWLLLFPCWWSIVLAEKGIFHTNPLYLLLFAIGALLMRSAGCIVNDLWDQKFDAAVERTKTRPLVSGEISQKNALAFLGALLGLSFLILLTLGSTAVVLGVLSLTLVGIYPLMKRVTWWPQLFLGFTFNWGALMGWAAVTGGLDAPAFMLYVGGIFWTLAYDTIYARQDMEDDARIGIRSTALLFGDKSPKLVALFMALAILLFLFSKLTSTPSPFIILFLLPVAAHAIWQMRTWDMENPQSCLRVFKSNQAFGWLVLLFFSL